MGTQGAVVDEGRRTRTFLTWYPYRRNTGSYLRGVPSVQAKPRVITYLADMVTQGRKKRSTLPRHRQGIPGPTLEDLSTTTGVGRHCLQVRCLGVRRQYDGPFSLV